MCKLCIRDLFRCPYSGNYCIAFYGAPVILYHSLFNLYILDCHRLQDLAYKFQKPVILSLKK